MKEKTIETVCVFIGVVAVYAVCYAAGYAISYGLVRAGEAIYDKVNSK